MPPHGHLFDDTIVATASPSGGAARGIIRLSGPRVLDVVAKIFDATPPLTNAPSVTAGQMTLQALDGRPLVMPTNLYLWPTHRSYTGEPVAEFHTIGSTPLLDATVRECCRHGARLAEPGEFTLRAFLSGRIDLTQAEAVVGTIDAENDAELDTALDQLAGGLARPLQSLRTAMLDLLAHLEAGFDYADEDLAFITHEKLAAGLEHCTDQTDALLHRLQRRADTSELVRVGLFGRSNVGKSSLFNTLSGDSHAIVSHHPGTTRDYLAATLDIDGVRFELIDTAGVDPEHLPETSPDRAARDVSLAQSKRVNVRLVCLDASSVLATPVVCSTQKEIFVITKSDTLDADQKIAIEQKFHTSFGSTAPIFTSTVTHEGIKTLLDAVCRQVIFTTAPGGTAVATTAARCEASLRDAADSLARASRLATASLGEELIASELRLALESLGKVAGTVYTEEILDHIFQHFCVGK